MTTTTPTRNSAPAVDGPGAAFNDVIGAALQVATAKVDRWAAQLNGVAAGGAGASTGTEKIADDLAAGGGAKQQAGVRAAQAGLEGNNPVWAAIKGAWAGGSGKVKAAIVAAAVTLVLLLVLSPVLLLVVLITGLIAVAVVKTRKPKR